MRWSSFFLLAISTAVSMSAQTAAPAAAPATSASSTALPLPANFASAKPALRPPSSLVPPARVRVSTAQRMAALNSKPPLPELPGFTAVDRDGKEVTPKTFSRTSHWLLVYRRKDCLPCDRLMNVLAASESPDLKGGEPYVILVDGKGSDAVDRVRVKYSTLSQSAWLADKEGHARAALKPRGEPTIYAMDGSKIAWSIPGNLGSPAKVEKMTAAWMASGAAANPANPSTSSTSGSSSAAAAAPATNTK